ncbi:RluA family pseudouridine synthase [Candidatus Poriferisodalis sp.]|uniref:RluA family pseudouridine synthase n=1 Tax=Candidatus Poriferisodalis sp. TaxID=3101277 RepID=UPI003B01B374
MNERSERVTVPEALSGERVDRAMSLLTGRSRSETADMVAQGRVLIDGEQVTTRSVRLSAGSTVEVTPQRSATSAAERRHEAVPFEVLHADADVVVVNKPAGVVTHPGSGHASGTLADALVERFPDMADAGQPGRPGIVHRLDRGTSGALVCARNRAAYDALVEQLSQRLVVRIYAALASGRPPAETGTIDAPIGRDQTHRMRMAVTSDGRWARTHYRVAEMFTHPVEASLLRCRLETGRTHQIRVHLAAVGLPLLGDLAYGVPDPVGIGRPLLHACRLSFRHPTSGADVDIEAPMPADFDRALTAFGSTVSAAVLSAEFPPAIDTSQRGCSASHFGHGARPRETSATAARL